MARGAVYRRGGVGLGLDHRRPRRRGGRGRGLGGRGRGRRGRGVVDAPLLQGLLDLRVPGGGIGGLLQVLGARVHLPLVEEESGEEEVGPPVLRGGLQRPVELGDGLPVLPLVGVDPSEEDPGLGLAGVVLDPALADDHRLHVPAKGQVGLREVLVGGRGGIRGERVLEGGEIGGVGLGAFAGHAGPVWPTEAGLSGVSNSSQYQRSRKGVKALAGPLPRDQQPLDPWGRWPYHPRPLWGRSSAGRASRSQREGRRFDPDRLHHGPPASAGGPFFQGRPARLRPSGPGCGARGPG